jgi:hypothetical protein
MCSAYELELVSRETDIVSSIEVFAADGRGADAELLKKIVSQTTYWVFNTDTGNFGAGKFVGFKGMDFDVYTWARDKERELGSGKFPPFLGGTTRKAIERVTGEFSSDSILSDKLAAWICSHLGLPLQPPRPKWRFVRVS